MYKYSVKKEVYDMQQFIKEIARGKRGSTDLTYEQAKEAARLIASGQATDAQIAAFFIAERIKTENADELLGFVHAFREKTKEIPLSQPLKDKSIDFASPYAGRNSFFATINKIVPIFASLPFKHVYVVQGIEGSEDVPVHRSSFVFTISEGEMESFIVNPKEYGLFVEEEHFEKKISVEKQAEYVTRILEGESSSELTYVYNQVVLNAGLRYYLFGYEASIEKGVDYAKRQLAEGLGWKHLQKWKTQAISEE